MKTLRCMGWLLAGLALVGSVGCGGSKKIKVAFVTNNPAEFWNIAEAGANKAAAEEDVELLFRRPESNGVDLQRNVAKSLLDQNIKALSISVINPEDQEADLNSFGERVPLLAIDNDAPKSKRLAYIGTDNYSAGRAAGKLVKEAIPEGGTVVFFVGDLAALNARQRRQGVIDEIKGVPSNPATTAFAPNDQEIIAGKYRIFDHTFTEQPLGQATCTAEARSALTRTLGKNRWEGKPVCMVGLWAYNAPAILTAINKEKDLVKPGDVKIVSFDEHEDTLKGIQNGEIYGTVVQQPFEFGYRSVKLMAALARNDKSKLPPNGIEYVPYRIVTREAGPARDGEPERRAAAAFEVELKKLLGK